MLKLLERIKGSRVSDKVGRNAGEQFRFKLQRDLREMEKIEQKYPDRLAPGLFFAWQRHQHLKADCEHYASELALLTGQTAEAVLIAALTERLAVAPDKVPAEIRYQQWFMEEQAADDPID